jgi:hypothetical protein
MPSDILPTLKPLGFLPSYCNVMCKICVHKYTKKYTLNTPELHIFFNVFSIPGVVFEKTNYTKYTFFENHILICKSETR